MDEWRNGRVDTLEKWKSGREEERKRGRIIKSGKMATVLRRVENWIMEKWKNLRNTGLRN